MLGNPEKITTSIPSNANQWPQIFDDHKSFMASSSSASKPTEKTNQDPHQQPLKCPRCDSSNTKFCYYNNYSLSQPRHFCKACKRYWTRGGTLRNVPVGGGCRKNKRAKRHPSNSIPAATPAIGNPSVRQPIDLSPASNHITNPSFFSLPANSLELNLPFSGLSSTRVSSLNAGFELQPQMNGPGIGFSPSALGDYKNGFRQIHDTSSSPFFSAAGNHSVFFGSSNSASTSTMASLLASSLQQQKLSPSGLKDNSGPSLMDYGHTQMPGRNEVMGKLVKMEGEYRSVGNPNQMEQINSSDPSSLLWNTTNVGTWFDPSNMGSSVPSLI